MKKLGVILTLSIILTNDYSIAENFEIFRFISSETCGECHSTIFEQWSNSMHNLSYNDFIYRNFSESFLNGLTERGELAEAESCVKCHIPVGTAVGNPVITSGNRSKVSGLASDGIQCDYCHSVKGCKKLYNNGLIIEPGFGENNPGIKRGPYKDSESDFHYTEFSEFHTKSKICGTCHNVKHIVFGTPLETTYDEWEKGPYNDSDPTKRTECQDCHMYQLPGRPATGSTPRPENPGYASQEGPKRKHLFTHYFIGGNLIVPSMFDDKIKINMAEERLKNAATIIIKLDKIREGKIKVRITNSGAGHNLPTGVTNFRQMWLQITVRDSRGNVVFESGRVNKKNYIPDGVVVYNTIFGDEKGNPVTNVSKASQIIKDNRIPPLGFTEETIIFPIKLEKDMTITAKLLYRNLSQKLVDQIMKENAVKIPIVTMAQTKKRI